jgi:probable O-glycosylation ligase (exosortase A-associated)
LPLREILLVTIVAGLVPVGLVRPLYGLFGFIWFSLMRPDYLAWATGKYPFAAVLALVTLVGTVRYVSRAGVLFTNPLAMRLILLQIPIGLSVLLCDGPFLSPDRYGAFMRMILIVLLIPILVQTERDLRLLLLVMALSLGGLGARFGLYGIMHGGVMFTHGIGDQYDNNTLGLVMAMTVPLCWYCRGLTQSWWLKQVMAGMVVTGAATVIMTHSRGASLSLAFGLLLIVARSRYKTLSICMLAIAMVPLVNLVKDEYLERMSTLRNFKEERSAASRIDFARAALAMWADYPLVGVGFGSRNYIAKNSQYLGYHDEHGVHNTWLQLLVDTGIFSYLLYAAMIFGSIVWLGRSGRHYRRARSQLQHIPYALQAGLLAFAVGGTFGSCERMDLVYMLLMAAAAWHEVEKQMEPAEAQAALEEEKAVEAPA